MITFKDLQKEKYWHLKSIFSKSADFMLRSFSVLICSGSSGCTRCCAVSLRATGKMSLGIFFKVTTLYHKSNFHLTKTKKKEIPALTIGSAK